MHDESLVAEAMRNIGAAAWRLGQRERAAANFRESLAIARREGLRLQEGVLLHDLGQTAFADRKTAEASRLFDRALEIRRSLGDQAGVTETLTSLASTRLAERRYDAALDLARRAVDNAVAHDQPELLWQAQTAAGVAYRRLGRPEDARRALSDAVRSIEQMSTEVTGGADLRQRFFEDKLSPYHELLALLVEEHSFGAALDLAERSKARVLAQLLRGNRADENTVLAADEKRERARLRDALYALNRQIESARAKPADEARVSALESTRREAREGLAVFEASLTGPSSGACGRARSSDAAHARRSGSHPPRHHDRHRRIRRNGSTVVCVPADERRHARHGRRPRDRHRGGRARETTERFRERISSRDFGVADEATGAVRRPARTVQERPRREVPRHHRPGRPAVERAVSGVARPWRGM